MAAWWPSVRTLKCINGHVQAQIKNRDCWPECSPLSLYPFLREFVGMGGPVGERNEMLQHSTALLFQSNSPTHLGWPFHFRVQQMER